MRDLLRGLTAMGFSALMIDRFGFPNNGDQQMREIRALLGDPIATRGGRLAAWDLRLPRSPFLHGMTAGAKRALARQMLDAPRLYMSTDVDPLTNRGETHEICASASITLVNPGRHHVRSVLDLKFRQRESAASRGSVEIGGRSVPITAYTHMNVIPVDVAPGVTNIEVSVVTPGVRCRSVPDSSLPQISVQLVPAAPGR
jgi:hypothetical protein